MEIAYSGTYTPKQLFRIHRAAQKALGGSSINSVVSGLTAAAIAMFILGAIQWGRGNSSGALQWFTLFAIAAVLAPAYAWSFRRSFAKHPHANMAVSGALREEGFLIRTPTTESTHAWSGVSSSYCDRDAIILIGEAQAMFAFSRELFASPQEFESACAFVTQHAPGKPPGLSPRRRIFRFLGWIVFVVFVMIVFSLWQTTGK